MLTDCTYNPVSIYEMVILYIVHIFQVIQLVMYNISLSYRDNQYNLLYRDNDMSFSYIDISPHSK